MKHIFSGLDTLGFENISTLELYKKKKEAELKNHLEKTNDNYVQNQLIHLYDRKVTCPICDEIFSAKAVKTSSYKMKSKDSDFFINYDLVNPYFYDVWICNSCGYSSMKADFQKIRNFQKDLIRKNITPKWKGRIYKEPYDINSAIERYKLSLLNYYYMESPASKKAMNCLKLAWMSRIIGDPEDEYLNQSLKGFNDAYFNENFPIYGMDKYTTMYLIGELNRRLGNIEDALLWFSKVITTPGINKRLKEFARDQKDLIKSSSSAEDKSESYSTQNDKKGFFSSLFNK